MIKLLFLTSGLTHGGVNKSLLNMVNLLDKGKYNLEIFPIYREGPYNHLFGDYNVIPVTKILPALFPFGLILKCLVGRKNLQYKMIDFCTRVAIHLFPKKYANRISNILSIGNYDVVISFQEGYTTELASYIKAPKHIAWVHCDYSRYISKRKKDESNIYKKYNYIVAVSEYTANIVREYVPVVTNKVFPIHNLMDQSDIVKQSQASIDDNRFQVVPFILISIGRMDSVKRFSLIPEMAKHLKANGIPFKWYIIGDGGGEKTKIEDAITLNHVENEVILLGAKDNPYPYIKQSSILVCPSLSEACPNVVNEGRILHIPVITADFPSAKEFITSGVTGFISPVEEISSLLIHLFQSKDDYIRILNNIKDYSYDNDKIMMKIENLFSS